MLHCQECGTDIDEIDVALNIKLFTVLIPLCRDCCHDDEVAPHYLSANDKAWKVVK